MKRFCMSFCMDKNFKTNRQLQEYSNKNVVVLLQRTFKFRHFSSQSFFPRCFFGFILVKNQSRRHAKKVKCCSTS